MHRDLGIEFFRRDVMVRELSRPLAEFLEMEDVTELVVNRPCEVGIKRGPQWEYHDVPELPLQRLMGLAQAIATFTEQEIGPQRPILSAVLASGERIQIVVPPAVEQDTISFTIRRPMADIKDLKSYEDEGYFDHFIWARPAELDARVNDLTRNEQALVKCLESNDIAGFLHKALQFKKNIGVVGDTGSGKTTLMKSMCQSIPEHERLLTIEDVRELLLPKHRNRTHLLYSKGGQGVAKVTPADLIASTMRMYPSRVLLAELRGGEAFDFLKLLTSGHSGSVTSWHAESCALAAERFVLMCKEHEQAAIYDAAALKRLVTLTIDIVIHVVAETVFDDDGRPIRTDRYIEEIHYDPVAKLIARFGNAVIHHAGPEKA